MQLSWALSKFLFNYSLCIYEIYIFCQASPLMCHKVFNFRSMFGATSNQKQWMHHNGWMVFWTWHCFPIGFFFFNYCPQQIWFKNVSRVILLGFHHLDDLKTWKRWLCVLGLLGLFPYFVLAHIFFELCIWTLQYCIFLLCLLYGANMHPLKQGACHAFQGRHNFPCHHTHNT